MLLFSPSLRMLYMEALPATVFGGNPMTDEELLHALKNNPNEGLELAMRRYTGLVYTIVYGRISAVGTPEDTEELVADVFVELWRSRENGDNDYRNDRTVGLQFLLVRKIGH
jgi:hypothetical protein